MSIVLYQGHGATDSAFEEGLQADCLAKYKHNTSDLLRVRGHLLALEVFNRFPWLLQNSTNPFADNFSVLRAIVDLVQYEEARTFIVSPAHNLAMRQIAETIGELGASVRLITVALNPDRKPEPSDSRCLTEVEIDKLVYEYIGVYSGYLGDFTYRTHRKFYSDLGLSINPDILPGTTRERFIGILTTSRADLQAQILQAILQKYPPDSNSMRTKALHDEITDWIRRLSSGSIVTIAPLRFTSAVVEHALLDAENLMVSRGATSGVDRVHTALHGYLNQMCRDANLTVVEDSSLTKLFKLLRSQHPQFQNVGVHSENIGRLLGAMATIVDVLNPIRNKASVAHPNETLLGEPEALLVINSVRTLLNYFDSKIRT
jgi:hypothetical protein